MVREKVDVRTVFTLKWHVTKECFISLRLIVHLTMMRIIFWNVLGNSLMLTTQVNMSFSKNSTVFSKSIVYRRMNDNFCN
jgi:hypothetical protein